MSDAGTITRPAELGPDGLTDEWWRKASIALLRRLLGIPEGDGPPEEDVDRLKKGLLIAFRAAQSDDLGERSVRTFLGASAGSSDRLYVTLADAFAARCGSFVDRQVASVSPAQDEARAAPSAAVDKKRSPLSAWPPRRSTGTRKVRPTPRSRVAGDGPGWWQKVIIDAQKAGFQRELAAREDMYQAYFDALDGSQKEKFAKNAAVNPNADWWEWRFKRAQQIALAARGITIGDADDAYHYADAADIPRTVKSDPILGELVHAAMQFDYLDAEPHSRVIAEYMYAVAASPSNIPPIRQKPLVDYRDLVADDEDPTLYSAAKWGFGKQKPDILDLTKRWIIEIKPMLGAPAGVLQLWRYTHNFNCARYFDELTSAGSAGPLGFALTPQTPDLRIFKNLDMNEFLKDYFAERDKRRDEAKKQGSAVPAKRRRVRRSEVERRIKAGRKLTIVPWATPDIPGLVLYSVHEDKPRDDDPTSEPSGATSGVVIGVVTTVLIAAAVLLAVALLPAAAATGTAMLAEGGTAAALGEGVGALVAEPVMMEAYGAIFPVTDFAAVAQGASETIGQYMAEGVFL